MKLLPMVALATLLLAPAAQAHEDLTTAALDRLQIHLGSTFACEPVLDHSYVEAARATAQGSLQRLGMSAEDAGAVVAQAEIKLRGQAAETAELVASQPLTAASRFCLDQYTRTRNSFDHAMTQALPTI